MGGENVLAMLKGVCVWGGGGHNKFWGSFNKGAGGTKFPPFKLWGGGGEKLYPSCLVGGRKKFRIRDILIYEPPPSPLLMTGPLLLSNMPRSTGGGGGVTVCVHIQRPLLC